MMMRSAATPRSSRNRCWSRPLREARVRMGRDRHARLALGHRGRRHDPCDVAGDPVLVGHDLDHARPHRRPGDALLDVAQEQLDERARDRRSAGPGRATGSTAAGVRRVPAGGGDEVDGHLVGDGGDGRTSRPRPGTVRSTTVRDSQVVERRVRPATAALDRVARPTPRRAGCARARGRARRCARASGWPRAGRARRAEVRLDRGPTRRIRRLRTSAGVPRWTAAAVVEGRRPGRDPAAAGDALGRCPRRAAGPGAGRARASATASGRRPARAAAASAARRPPRRPCRGPGTAGPPRCRRCC